MSRRSLLLFLLLLVDTDNHVKAFAFGAANTNNCSGSKKQKISFFASGTKQKTVTI
ncbi:MAG: hypothetical protein ACI8RD_011546 [Bacillariaceae sp.]|jgi:hypothetical protein